MAQSDADRPLAPQPDESPTDAPIGTAAEASAKPTAEATAEAASGTADLEDRLRRALADADNARKRCERRVVDARTEERARVSGAWLSIVDNLERALEHAEADSGAVIDGVRAVRDQAVALLGSLGFRRHDETGVPFDPQLHEAVGVVPDPDAQPGTVLRVLRAGYGDGVRELRPAAVVVAGGPSEGGADGP
jgi:molecular chaperone GrpE